MPYPQLISFFIFTPFKAFVMKICRYGIGKLLSITKALKNYICSIRNNFIRQHLKISPLYHKVSEYRFRNCATGVGISTKHYLKIKKDFFHITHLIKNVLNWERNKSILYRGSVARFKFAKIPYLLRLVQIYSFIYRYVIK